jgi:site-specific recombinase XerD
VAARAGALRRIAITSAHFAPRQFRAADEAPQAAAKPPVRRRPSKLAGAASAALADLAERYIAEAHAPATRTAYQGDWRAFAAWCSAKGYEALPATSGTFEQYLAHMEPRGLKASTIRRARIAIGLAHGHAHLPRPDQDTRVKALERGIGRVHGTREEGAEPLLADQVATIVRLLGRTTRGELDRAIILLGFAAALRPSELAGLDVTCVRFTDEGLELLLAKSKEDQLQKGELVRLPRASDPQTCPLAALRTWMIRVGRPAGPLFRHVRGAVIEHERLTTRTITRVVQHAVELAGFVGDYSGHSLRAGMATSAFEAGTRELDIKAHGRWKTLTSLHRYIHTERIRQRVNAASGLL